MASIYTVHHRGGVNDADAILTARGRGAVGLLGRRFTYRVPYKNTVGSGTDKRCVYGII